MAKGFGIRVLNARKVINSLNKAGSTFERNLKKHSNRIGIILVGEAHRLIKEGYYRPAYQTGSLYRGVSYFVHSNSKVISIDFGTAVDYGIYVHEGTIHMEKRPFLTDAVKNKMKEINREIKQAFSLTGI